MTTTLDPVSEDEVLAKLRVGSRVWFEEERRGYTVQARNSNIIICTKPFNLKHTTLYTIIDVQRKVRGPDNHIFGAGYETREQCRERLAEFEAPGSDMEVSWRRCISLMIDRASI